MKVWKLYVDLRTLSNTSTVLDLLVEYDVNENASNLLFAISDNKKKLKRFFEIHRKEMFLVVEAEMTKDDYKDMLEYDPHLKTDFLLQDVPIMVFAKTEKGCIRMSYPAVLTGHENKTIEFGLEMVDDMMYELYTHSPRLRYYYEHNIFTKKVKKALKTLGLIHTLDELDKYYSSSLKEPCPVFYLNEWALLRDQYADVLIGGGDRYEDPFV